MAVTCRYFIARETICYKRISRLCFKVSIKLYYI